MVLRQLMEDAIKVYEQMLRIYCIYAGEKKNSEEIQIQTPIRTIEARFRQTQRTPVSRHELKWIQ